MWPFCVQLAKQIFHQLHWQQAVQIWKQQLTFGKNRDNNFNPCFTFMDADTHKMLQMSCFTPTSVWLCDLQELNNMFGSFPLFTQLSKRTLERKGWWCRGNIFYLLFFVFASKTYLTPWNVVLMMKSFQVKLFLSSSVGIVCGSHATGMGCLLSTAIIFFILLVDVYHFKTLKRVLSVLKLSYQSSLPLSLSLSLSLSLTHTDSESNKTQCFARITPL